jgi:hypothetical protein
MGVLKKVEPRHSAASKAKPLVRAGLCLVVLAFILPLHATAEEKPNSFCDAIEKYILRVDDIAHGIDDAGKRRIQYDIALKKLMDAAHTYFGPSCPCDEILRDAKFQEYTVESYRKPPPGWEPGPTPENVVLFTQISRHTLRAQMELTKWCWEKQSGTDLGEIPSGRRSHADARSRK